MAEKRALKGQEAAAAREADASMERERQKAILRAQVAHSSHRQTPPQSIRELMTLSS